MPVFDQLPRASFDGIEFPVRQVEVSGGLRDHVHEYPHSPGGAPEKLGRKLYSIRMSAIFDARVLGYGDNLWPGDLSDLFDRFDDQTTADLVIPTLGTISAYCVTWSKTASFERRSGETAELEFREDQSQAFLVNGLINVNTANMQDAGTQYDIAFAPVLAGGTLQPTGVIAPPPATATTPPRAITKEEAFSQLRARDADILTKIRAGWTDALTLADKGELYASQIQAKAFGVIEGCSRAYATIQILKDPLMWSEVRALKRLWQAARTLYDNAAGTANRILLYRTPTIMSVADISRAVYGDTQRAILIMRLNAFNDAFRIPRDTIVRYFDPTTLRGETI